MTTSEPTTGEIVRLLRMCATTCQGDCYYYDNRDACAAVLKKDAADRLESQEAQIKQLTEALAYANEWHKESVENATNELRELSGIAGELEAMTARAEQAEKWAAAAITDIERLRLKKFTLCPICEFEDVIGCAHKNHCIGYKQFKWRGLPQDGERK